jgi:hypothetical protein
MDPRLTCRLRLRGIDQILIHMEPAKAVSEAA